MNRHVWLILVAVAMIAILPAFAGDHGKCTMSTQDCLDHMAASMKSSGWVGVELDTDKAEGYAVTKVIPGSPAEAAGIEAGDILVALNGVALKKENDEALMKARKDWKPGQTFPVYVKQLGPPLVLARVNDRTLDGTSVTTVDSAVVPGGEHEAA